MKDLLIIGGGPGGYVAAIRARQLGLEVALVEKDQLGGTCLNRGCIPTKAYYKNAEVMRTMSKLEEYNIQSSGVQFNMAAARQRKETIVNNLVAGVAGLLKANGVEVINGQASIQDATTVIVKDQVIKCRRILIASGSESADLPVPGANLPGVMKSEDILDIEQVPAELIIIGGGVVGMEFAGIFNSFGSRVTVLEYAPQILNTLDSELIKRSNVIFKRQGIEIHTGTKVQSIQVAEGGLQVTAVNPKGTLIKEAALVLVAAGRKPVTDGLNLAKLGITTGHGFIQVDENFETNVKGIYAIGDVIGAPMLAHVASEEAMVAVERMAGLDSRVSYHAVPGCIFTFPEIATVGISEDQAKQQGIDYQTGKFQFGANGKAMTLGETDGLVKVIADQEDTIIGVHIMGPHASDLILEATLMVKNRMKINDVKGVIHPHPTLGETLAEAIAAVKGTAIHLQPPRGR
ncbi:Dihydrolipoamide dehydrogenase [Syntrophomonas zehnderi OL-4]|uniref:Dihydrolipoyl dehydrogenase n=1 Tax=Syntrophomonas zehnderi OL-4 TaxID=690567 RepID=A0A0E4GCP3_9FIRM|nr:dihydrolipoyl dehydrogenase [Syntrophomonas zehnderi]CFX18344.1 Dihydrolipoamide dehydrogenase [Syntrophomonas zehnderi OL-4]